MESFFAFLFPHVLIDSESSSTLGYWTLATLSVVPFARIITKTPFVGPLLPIFFKSIALPLMSKAASTVFPLLYRYTPVLHKFSTQLIDISSDKSAD